MPHTCAASPKRCVVSPNTFNIWQIPQRGQSIMSDILGCCMGKYMQNVHQFLFGKKGEQELIVEVDIL